jgi:hypothetical protein
MNALTKLSIALLLLTESAIAVYLYVAPSDENFAVARSQPQGPICKQDEQRLARLQAHPSLDESLRFVSEIQCMQLRPQLQTLMDQLSNPSRSTASSGPDGAASSAPPAPPAPPASDAAPAPVATLAASDEACKHDEDRRAELWANPSVDAAVRFDRELKCPRLQPQLPAILMQLSQAARPNPNAPAPDVTAAVESVPPTRAPPAEATSAASDDACKRDEHRLTKLQANPSVDEAIRLSSELNCARLQPQLQAILDNLSHAPRSAAAQPADGALPDGPAAGANSASEAAPPALAPSVSEATSTGAPNSSETPSKTAGAGETAPQSPKAPISDGPAMAEAPSSNGSPLNTTSAREAAPPAAEATSTAIDDACKHDAARLAELQAKPSIDGALRFEEEFKCSKLQSQLLALLDSLSPPPQSVGALSSNGSPPNTTSTEAGSPPAAAPPASEVTSAGASSPTKTSPNTAAVDEGANSASEAAPLVSAPPAPQAASAESGSDDACKPDEERLARLRAAPSSEEATRFTQEVHCARLRPELLALMNSLAKPPLPDSASVPPDAVAGSHAANETPPAPQAAADADRRIAALESEKAALAAKVSQLERDRETSSANVAMSAPPPQPVPAKPSEAQPDSQAAADTERRIAGLVGEKEVLTAEVSRLQRDREAPSAGQANATSPLPSSRAERSEPEPASQAAERRIAELESENEALTAEVSRLQHDREAPPIDEAKSAPSPLPAAPAEPSKSEAAAASAAALASLPEGMPARVLIRFVPNNADARAEAQKLANALKRQGVAVADLRESASAIRTELSFAYAPDKTIAQQVGRLVGAGPVRRFQPKDGLMVRPGTIELNLSGDSHLAAIKATSSRESNHE